MFILNMFLFKCEHSLSDMYVALLSCFNSLMHLKVRLIELVKKIFRCCIYIDVTILPYDIALKMFPKYPLGVFFHLHITCYRHKDAYLAISCCFCVKYGEAVGTTMIGTQLYFTSVKQRYKMAVMSS